MTDTKNKGEYYLICLIKKIHESNFWVILDQFSKRYSCMNNIKKVLKAQDMKEQSQQQHFYKIK